MVAIKAHQAAKFLKSIDRRITGYLFYGSDAGLVSERAALIAKALAKIDDPPGEILRLDDSDLENDPDRLSVELRTIPMFGGRKIVRTTAGRRVNAAAISDIVGDENLSGTLVVEAGNLKPNDKLRKLFEAPPTTAAIACFADAANDLANVIAEVMTSAGQTIDTDARALLITRLGADRALSRGEVEKLSLYAMDRTTITIEDVDAVVGDVSQLAFDRVNEAVAAGRAKLAIAEYSRTVASGESPQAIIASAGRYFHRLHRVRSEMDRGQPVDTALRLLRPPLHFKQRDSFTAQLRNWTGPRLLSGIRLIATASASARRTAHLEDLIAERLLMNLLRLARNSS
ncbi:MAG: DNA polymerase III subunit delta [Hyphomicrobiaceae bacterium]